MFVWLYRVSAAARQLGLVLPVRTGKVLACSFEINGSIRDVDLRQG